MGARPTLDFSETSSAGAYDVIVSDPPAHLKFATQADAEESDPQPLKRERIWLDIGSSEGTADESGAAMTNVRTLTGVLKGSGMHEGQDFVSRTIEGAKHNETAWAARFGNVLQFFFAN